MTIALIDGDILLYRIGFTTENDPEGIARVRMDDLVDSILMETDAKEFEVWLSDSKEGNFRYQVAEFYKANRVAPRPKHYELLKEYLVREWGARFAHGMEADDAMGIAQVEAKLGTVICSIDKDLLQIPGVHYNFVKKEWLSISPWEGTQWFYKQILIGDNSDNIKGCKGIGPVKAGKALDPIHREKGEGALFDKVFETYQKQETEKSLKEILDHVLVAGRLLKIKQQQEEELWNFPESSRTMAILTLLSTQQEREGSTPSTVDIGMEKSGLLEHGVEADISSSVKTPASI